MTSGKLNTPQTLNCQECNTLILWIGGRKRIYCSHKCGDRARHRIKYTSVKPFGPKLTARERARLKREHQQTLVRNEKLKRGNCVDCGLVITLKTLPCIAFDHRDPQEKTFTIARQMGRASDQNIIDEMKKCDAVCHNCHALRTHNNKHWNVRRGK